MKRLVTVTDVTRMREGRVCVAGYLPDGTCVRPDARGGLSEDWLYDRGKAVVRPFARVELDFLQRQAPYPPHTEDWAVNPAYRVQHGLLDQAGRKTLLSQLDDGTVEVIFGAPIHRDPGFYVMAGEGTRSLGTIRPAWIGQIMYREKEAGRWDYRLSFTDDDGEEYRLAVVDLAFRYYLDHRRTGGTAGTEQIARDVTDTLRSASVFLRIGLARGWSEYPDRCYLQITGVYSFPDYLGGRCFADLAPQRPPSIGASGHPSGRPGKLA